MTSFYSPAGSLLLQLKDLSLSLYWLMGLASSLAQKEPQPSSGVYREQGAGLLPQETPHSAV